MNDLDVLGFDPEQLSIYDDNSQKKNGNPNIYKPDIDLVPKDSDGIYRATVKVLYNPFNFKDSIVEVQSYSLTDSHGWFSVVSSLTDDNKSCPIFQTWAKLRYSKNPVLEKLAMSEDKGGPGYFDKRYARYVTVQIIEDNNQPELVGRYMIMKLPKNLYDIIDNKMKPSAESKKAKIPVLDLLFGRTIELEIKPGPNDPKNPQRRKRECSYSTSTLSEEVVSCTYPDGTSLLNDEEKVVLDEYVSRMSKVWKSKDPVEREALKNEIDASDCRKQLNEIYRGVVAKVQTFCPNIRKEVGYAPWSEKVATRVQNYLDLIVAGKNPREVDSSAAIDAFNASAEGAQTNQSSQQSNQPTPQTTETAAPQYAPTPETNTNTAPMGGGDKDEDLPF